MTVSGADIDVATARDGHCPTVDVERDLVGDVAGGDELGESVGIDDVSKLVPVPCEAVSLESVHDPHEDGLGCVAGIGHDSPFVSETDGSSR